MPPYAGQPGGLGIPPGPLGPELATIPEEPVRVRTAWRNVQPRQPKKLRKSAKDNTAQAAPAAPVAAAGPSTIAHDTRTEASWETWQRESS